MNSSMTTSFGSLFSLSLMWIATAKKDKINIIVKIINIKIEDKTFLHKNHKGNQKGKFHLKITIKSQELKRINKIQSNKKIFHLLDEEMKNFIHSIQILIN